MKLYFIAATIVSAFFISTSQGGGSYDDYDGYDYPDDDNSTSSEDQSSEDDGKKSNPCGDPKRYYECFHRVLPKDEFDRKLAIAKLGRDSPHCRMREIEIEGMETDQDLLRVCRRGTHCLICKYLEDRCQDNRRHPTCIKYYEYKNQDEDRYDPFLDEYDIMCRRRPGYPICDDRTDQKPHRSDPEWLCQYFPKFDVCKPYEEGANIQEKPSIQGDNDDSEDTPDQLNNVGSQPQVGTDVISTSTNPGVSSTNSGASSTNSGVSSTNPGVSVTNPGVSSTTPGVSSTNSGVSSTNSGFSITTPGVSSTNSGVSSTNSGVSITNPGVSSTNSGVSVTNPGVSVTNPGVSSTNPGVSVTNPGGSSGRPVVDSIRQNDLRPSAVQRGDNVQTLRGRQPTQPRNGK